ncbi:aldo/keto reductase [Fulvimarina sp. MAC8]|uniref:aldo/keto reductase n=1 Tax=Fulvimarina sp. MAC8 TaxID=3162874 RepID=UPI0032EB7CCE
MRKTEFIRGESVPVIGQGTWHMGDNPEQRESEIAALRTGIDLGMTVIDTAEMYGSGRSEQLVGEAIAPVRDDVFLVSKVLPSNASRSGTIAACEASLKRLGTDHIDLYLLHWRGSVPFGETIEAFEALREQGKIRHWGVSNLDRDDMDELLALGPNAKPVVNQLYYSVAERGIEFGFRDWLRSQEIGVMAYTPFGVEGAAKLKSHLGPIAERHGATPAQIALAYLIRQDGVLPIPKASSETHVRENAAAAEIDLTAEDLSEIDAALPPPTRARPLAII